MNCIIDEALTWPDVALVFILLSALIGGLWMIMYYANQWTGKKDA